MKFYKRWPGDIQIKTGHLTPAEFGCYDRLLDHYYATETGLPSPERCYSICRAITQQDREACDRVLAEFFEAGADGRLRQERTEETIAEALPRIEAARTNGKKGGRPRKDAPAKPNKKPSGLSAGNPNEGTGLSETRDLEKLATTQKSSSTKKTPLAPKGVAVSGGFQRFWDAWPKHHRKAGRYQCWAKWKAREFEARADEIVAHVQAMARSEAWKKDDGEFIPAPMTYLNQDRFEAPLQQADDGAAQRAIDETQRLLREQEEHGRRVEAERLARKAAKAAKEASQPA